jgi:hypothetical protein
MWTECNTSLNEYQEVLLPIDATETGDYRVQRINENLYNYFPVGAAIVSIPFVAAADVWFRAVDGVRYRDVLMKGQPLFMESLVASSCVAVTAVVLYAIGLSCFGGCVWKSVLLAFIFAFCTSAWSVVSRSLWAHGPSMMLLSVALYLFLRAEHNHSLIPYTGIPLALAYVVRPTNSIPIIIFSCYVLIRHRRFMARYLGWSACIAIPFIAYNMFTYGAILSPYYQSGRLGQNAHFWEALAGNLISPARGIFVFSPILILALGGICVIGRTRRLTPLEICLIAIILLHWLAISTFAHWWGGHSYGPRFFSDILPFLVYFLYPVIDRLGPGVSRYRLAWVALCALLAMASFAIHFRGATDFNGSIGWNVVPTNIDEHPDRLWDWRNPQFLYRQ